MFGEIVSAGVRRVTTADAYINGTAGRPNRVFCVNLVSGSTGGTVLQLMNGSAGDVLVTLASGTASRPITQNFSHGVYFSNGCYADVDANVSYATFITRDEV